MTALFSSFPFITYDQRYIKNTSIRLDLVNKIKDNLSLFQFITISDTQTPEQIAYKYYADSELFWIVLMLNNIVDPFYDWLLSEQRLFDYVTRKYGAENIYSIHHYETTENSPLGKGYWVSVGTPFSNSVSNWQYEYDLNETKRKIKILKPRYLQQVLSEYEKELKLNGE